MILYGCQEQERITPKQITKRGNWTDIVSVSTGCWDGSTSFAIHTVGLRSDGTVLANGNNDKGQCGIFDWSNIVQVEAGAHHTVGLKSDGTVIAIGDNENGQCNVNDWTDIIAVSAALHTVGLKSDGTVVATGANETGQCDVSDWTDIIAISAGGNHTVGLKSNGTVVATTYTGDKQHYDGECEVETWTDIVAISAGCRHTVGLKSDGTVVAIGENFEGGCNVTEWTDIIAINTSTWGTVGLKADGTVVRSVKNDKETHYVTDWNNIRLPSSSKPSLTKPVDNVSAYAAAEALLANGETARAAIAFGKLGDYKDARERSFALWEKFSHRDTISSGYNHVVGIKTDGALVATGMNNQGQCDVTDWTDIVAVSAGSVTLGLKSDGTVAATGVNHYGQCEVTDWTDIVAISAGGLHCVGLKADGTVLAVGRNEEGQCNVSDWTDIIAVSAADHTVGLKTNGTVIATGANYNGECNVGAWNDIVAISAGGSFTVGLKTDGSVVAVGLNHRGQCDVNFWTDIIAIWADDGRTIGLKADGTVVAAGNVASHVKDWTDIVAVTGDYYYTVGLKADGTVVGIGIDVNNLQTVIGWEDIKLPNLELPHIDNEVNSDTQQERYDEAEALLANGETAKAAIAFGKLGNYKDARERSIALWEGDTVSAGPYHVAAIQNNGSVVAVGHERFGQDQCQVQDWKDIVSVAASGELTAGLKSDGTVVVTYTEDLDFREAVSHWEDIIQIGAAGRSIVGLKSDGSIVWVKQVNGTPICDLTDDLNQWNDIIGISVCDGNQIAGRNDWKNSPAIVGLRRDGTVVLHGFDEKIAQNVSEWKDIISIHAAGYGICGRNADGTIAGAYLNQNIADVVSKWTDIIDIDSSSVEGGIYVIGVRSDGTTATWGDHGGLDGASHWTDIVSLDIGDITGMCFKRPIIGLKTDGTVMVTGWRGEQPDLSAFTDIRLP